MGFDACDVDDLVQRAAFTYWRKFAKVLPGRERAFAEAILVREAARARRNRARRREASADEATPRSSGAPRLDDQLHQQRRLAQVRRVIDELPQSHQHLFQLHVWDGLTCEQIAEREQVPLGTVKTRIRAVRNSLRGELDG